MKKLLEKPPVLGYRSPPKPDPLAYWISPRAFFFLLVALSAAFFVVGIVVYRGVYNLANAMGYLFASFAAFVWHVELRK